MWREIPASLRKRKHYNHEKRLPHKRDAAAFFMVESVTVQRPAQPVKALRSFIFFPQNTHPGVAILEHPLVQSLSSLV
jgi:hypothetical protein